MKKYETTRIDWFNEINRRLKRFSEGNFRVRSFGDEILCKTESAADAIADLLVQFYAADDDDIVVTTGYYDPEEDERNNETDERTGWYYVNIE